MKHSLLIVLAAVVMCLGLVGCSTEPDSTGEDVIEGDSKEVLALKAEVADLKMQLKEAGAAWLKGALLPMPFIFVGGMIAAFALGKLGRMFVLAGIGASVGSVGATGMILAYLRFFNDFMFWLGIFFAIVAVGLLSAGTILGVAWLKKMLKAMTNASDILTAKDTSPTEAKMVLVAEQEKLGVRSDINRFRGKYPAEADSGDVAP